MTKLWRVALLTGCPFLLLCLCGIIALGSQKTVTISAEGGGGTIISEGLFVAGETFRLTVEEAGEEPFIVIPTPGPMSPELLQMETDCFGKQIRLGFTGAEPVFFAARSITAGQGTLKSAGFIPDGNNTYVVLELSDYFETESTLKEDRLEIRLVSPAEKYEKAVLLEIPENEAYTDEERGLLESLAAETASDLESRGIKAYRLRQGDSGNTVHSRLRSEFATRTGARLYLALGLNKDADLDAVGTLVQCSDMFLPEVSSVTAADLVEKNLCMALESYPLGVVRKGDNLPADLRIPEILVYPGFSTSPREKALLQNPAYQKRIGQGIGTGTEAFLTETENR